MDSTPDPPGSDPEAPRRSLPWPLILGGVVLLALLIGGAVFFLRPHGRPAAAPTGPEAATGEGLRVDVAQAPPDSFNATQPLRCFVDGRFVGLQTLAECARRNGVAPGALDVGVDDTGALAAATDTQLQPLPPQLSEQVQTAQVEATRDLSPTLPPIEAPSPPPPVRRVATGPCWRDSGGGNWERVADDVTLSACTSALFDGQCVVQPGSALYGRWSEETLRLVPGRVEAGGRGGRFRTLVEQSPGSCGVPAQ